MGDLRNVGLRRCHVVAEGLLDVVCDTETEPVPVECDFAITLPDARVVISLAVFFVPTGDQLGRASGDSSWGGVFDPSTNGLHTLSLQAMESAAPVSNRLLPVENVFGSPSDPVPLAGDVFGWLVSARPESREWAGRFTFNAPNGWVGGGNGRWVVRATATDDTGGMTVDEWQRVVDRLAIRCACRTVNIYAGE